MKKFFSGLLMIISLQFVSGQDKIITIQHDTIHCRIMSVSPAHVHYEQMSESGYIVGNFIPTEQVLTYLRKDFDPNLRMDRQKSRWMLCVHLGRSSTLASTTEDEKFLINAGASQSQVDDYFKQLRHGWFFGGDLHYMLSDHFGLGAKYSLFTSSAQLNFSIDNPSSSGFGSFLNPRETIYINYTAPSVIFRQWLDENQKFQLIETLSVGYVNYRNELRLDSYYDINNMLGKGNTWGANVGLSVGYFPLTWLSVGLNAGFMYARLTKIKISAKDRTETIKLEKSDYEYLTRLDYSLSISFHF